jgi:hypothetical protein
MAKTIKEAADNLLKNGSITQEEYDSIDFEKTGSNILKAFSKFNDVARQVPMWLPISAVAGGVAAKEGIIDPIIQSGKIKKSYSQLEEKVPQLAGVDQDKIRDYFAVIKSFSPHAAANPLVAGALVNKMVEFGGVDHRLVQDIVNLNSGKPTNESIKTMVGGGLKSMAGIPKGSDD